MTHFFGRYSRPKESVFPAHELQETHPLLTLQIKSFSYNSEESEDPPRNSSPSLFNNLSLTLPRARWTCLLGASGIGKTTLLRLIAGLIPLTPKTMNITYHGTEQNDPSAKQSIAYMAQHDLLLPWLTVLDNVCLGATLRGEPQDNLLKDKAIEILKRLKLGEAATLYPTQLSVGMRQRVALARTLLEECPLVLMDEPFSAVDAVSRLQLQELAFELLENKTVFLVTHDPLEALRMGEEIYVLNRPHLSEAAELKGPLLLSSPPLRENQDKEIFHHYSQLLEWIGS